MQMLSIAITLSTTPLRIRLLIFQEALDTK